MHPDSFEPNSSWKLSQVAEEALAPFTADRSFWDAVLDALRDIASSQINRYVWFGGHKPHPEDVAHDALYAVISGTRPWIPTEPVNVSLLRACSSAIWSLVGNKLESSKAFPEVSYDASGDLEPNFDTSGSRSTPAATQTPLDALLAAENWSEFLNLLPAADSEANCLLHRIVELNAFANPVREEPHSGTRPRKPKWSNIELAEQLAVTVEAIENAKKRLRTVLDAYLWMEFTRQLPDDGRPWEAFADEADGDNLPSDWKAAFAKKHSMTVAEVTEMGAELIDLFDDWRRRTLPDATRCRRPQTRA